MTEILSDDKTEVYHRQVSKQRSLAIETNMVCKFYHDVTVLTEVVPLDETGFPALTLMA